MPKEFGGNSERSLGDSDEERQFHSHVQARLGQ